MYVDLEYLFVCSRRHRNNLSKYPLNAAPYNNTGTMRSSVSSRAYNLGHILQSRDPGISGLGKDYPIVLNLTGFYNVII